MPVLTVSQLNNYMRRYVDNNKNLSGLYIKGEISNFKGHSSGHLYLTLKDNGSVLKCVMFYSYASQLKFVPENGMKVIAFGNVSVYEAGGVYQLYIEHLVPDGKGELYAAYEQLKSELEQLGYFDISRKKSLPQYPETIGVVTSSEGAAVKDIISVLGRRYPLADVILYPALVQGVGAAQSISDGISYFSNSKVADVIIIGRGGGSIEDLWAFNERIVADAIYECKIPVISAVGHETDFTISDFVADMRAPTPSAAAEMAVPDIISLTSNLRNISDNLYNYLNKYILSKRYEFESVIKSDINNLIIRYIQDKKIVTDDIVDNLNTAYKDRITKLMNSYSTLCTKLDALSPLKVLSRGFSIVKHDDKILTSVKQVSSGDNVEINVSDGIINCSVK